MNAMIDLIPILIDGFTTTYYDNLTKLNMSEFKTGDIVRIKTKKQVESELGRRLDGYEYRRNNSKLAYWKKTHDFFFGSTCRIEAIDIDGDLKSTIEGSNTTWWIPPEWVKSKIIEEVPLKFKVGDMVRLKKSGRTGAVWSIDTHGSVSILFGDGNVVMPYDVEEIEPYEEDPPLKFKVGDKVRNMKDGRCGTIIKVDAMDDRLPYEIDLGRGDSGWARGDDYEKIEEPEEKVDGRIATAFKLKEGVKMSKGDAVKMDDIKAIYENGSVPLVFPPGCDPLVFIDEEDNTCLFASWAGGSGDGGNNRYVFNNLTPNNMSNYDLAGKIKRFLTGEPKKSLLEEGVITESGFLTQQGGDAFVNWLFEKHQQEFYEEAIKPMREEKSCKKKSK